MSIMAKTRGGDQFGRPLAAGQRRAQRGGRDRHRRHREEDDRARRRVGQRLAPVLGHPGLHRFGQVRQRHLLALRAGDVRVGEQFLPAPPGGQVAQLIAAQDLLRGVKTAQQLATPVPAISTEPKSDGKSDGKTPDAKVPEKAPDADKKN